MSTPGFDPHHTLWHLFHGDDYLTSKLPLTAQQRESIQHIVGVITENRMHPDGSSLLGRFLKLMAEKTGKSLTTEHADLADGLLTCLNPYQAGEPFATPETIRLGISDHFKGGVYKVRGFSMWASGNGEKVVEYTSLLHGTDHTRLATQWCEVVKWPDGKYRSRFVYRGPDLKTPAPAYKVPSPVV